MEGKLSNTFQDFFVSVSKYKIPGDRRKVFEWLKTIALLDPTIYPIILALAEYPITDITVAVSDKQKSIRSERLEKVRHTLFVEQDIVGHLMDIGLDVGIYGSAFVSPAISVERTGTCMKCGANASLEDFGDLHVSIDRSVPREMRDKLKKVKYKGKCPKCGYRGEIAVTETSNQKRSMIKWSPLSIDIKYTDYDGHYEYYYTPTKHTKAMFESGNKHILTTADSSMLYSLLTGKTLKVKTIYHFKARGASMIWPGWPLPPIMSVLTTVWYKNLLMRAQEAVAMDFLVPLRVIYYQNSDAQGKIQTASIRFKRMLEREIKKWRRDPNRVVALPFPVQQLQLLYGGRNLLVSPEIQLANQMIAEGLGFPPNILSGDMTYSGGSITLRMLANRFSTLTSGYRRYLNDFYKKYIFPEYEEDIELSMTKFQIADDVAKLQLLTQTQMLSHRSLYEILGVDAETEVLHKKQDMADQALLSFYNQKLQLNLQKASTIEQAMGQSFTNPEELRLVLDNPTSQLLKFVTDYMNLPDDCSMTNMCKSKVAQTLATQTPEIWAAMEEIIEKNNLLAASSARAVQSPANAAPSTPRQPAAATQGNPPPVSGNTAGGEYRSGVEATRSPNLIKDKVRE